MKILLNITLLASMIIFNSCSSKVVSIEKQSEIILKNSLSLDIPQIQNITEITTLRENRVKSMAFILQNENPTKEDSITFLEFDFGGKLKYRTSTENTTQGCLPFMLKQFFIYDKDKLKKVIDYTFKYKSKSIWDNWQEKDTTRLRLYDWEDYTYNGDTITVETGYGITKFIMNKEGDIVHQIDRIKTNNQVVKSNYKFTGYSILREINNSINSEKGMIEYANEDNKVINSFEIEGIEFRIEEIYDSNGLLQSIIKYKSGKPTSHIKISYEYYLK